MGTYMTGTKIASEEKKSKKKEKKENYGSNLRSLVARRRRIAQGRAVRRGDEKKNRTKEHRERHDNSNEESRKIITMSVDY